MTTLSPQLVALAEHFRDDNRRPCCDAETTLQDWYDALPAEEVDAVLDSLTVDLGTCQWFALCTNDATTTERHLILGDVPICARCKEKNARLR